MQDDIDIAPWYKQFWPWFLIGILVFAVVIGLGLLFISIAYQDSMVRDNYYKEGRAINMHLGRDKMASDLDLAASFTIDEMTGEVSLTLTGDLPSQPSALQFDLISPSHADRDRVIVLNRVAENAYAGQMPERIEGRHYVDLSDPARPGEAGWRLTDEVFLASDRTYQLDTK
ncbi:FixH family protein [Halopseudomonas salina]|uniref:Membrane protein n=1 Tax=Halopseudomonas salina TaxID=1323744 RepID=A0ABQ1P8D0_9GAMM|nr:FixH family protein [Halopseudomonas salina]GGC88776.1 membrane protein [Halopseudomonas salina]